MRTFAKLLRTLPQQLRVKIWALESFRAGNESLMRAYSPEFCSISGVKPFTKMELAMLAAKRCLAMA